MRSHIFLCLSLILLSSWASAKNSWENDNEAYEEVMKKLQEEGADQKKYVATSDLGHEEAEKAAHLSTYLFTQHSTWIQQGEETTNGKTTSWTSTFVSSWISSLTSSFQVQETTSPAVTSYYTSYYTYMVTEPAEVEWTLDKELTWSTEFDAKSCQCNEAYLSANSWLALELQNWSKAVTQLKQQVYSWYKKNKKVGIWWVYKANDARYELWIQWVAHLEKLRSKYAAMGSAKFKATYETELRAKLKSLTDELQKRVTAVIQEGEQALKWQKDAAAKQKLAVLTNYTAHYLQTYNLISANIWRRDQTAKFGAVLLKIHSDAQVYFSKTIPTETWWWSSFLEVINIIYQEYVAMLEEWYVAIRVHGYSWYTTHLRQAWRTSLNQVKQLTGTTVGSLRKSSIELFTELKKNPKLDVKTKVNELLSKRIQEFKTATQTVKQKIAVSIKAAKSKAITSATAKVKIGKKRKAIFSVKTCQCSKGHLDFHKWQSAQLEAWNKSTMKLKTQFQQWYKQHSNVGLWWIRRVVDDMYQLWIEWATFLNQLRSKYVAEGKAKYQSQATSKLQSLVDKLQKRITKRTKEGAEAAQWQKQPAMKAKLQALYAYKFRFRSKKRRLSAEIWRRKQITTFRALLLTVYGTGKAWYKKHGARLQWWWKSYRRLINALYKDFIMTLRIYVKGIRQYGFRWYMRFARPKWTSFVQVYNKRVTALAANVIALSSTKLVVKSGAISVEAQKQFLNQLISLRREFSHISVKLRSTLRGYLSKGWRLEIAPPAATLPMKAPKTEWSMIFTLKDCKCTKPYLLYNRWLYGRLKKWNRATRKLRKQIRAWFKRNKTVGKWWIRRALDDQYQLWIEWATYLSELRAAYIREGAAKFEAIHKSQAKARLQSILAKLQKRVTKRIKQGADAVQWMKQPAMKVKLQALQRYQFRFQMRYRNLSAKLWRRKQITVFGAFLMTLFAKAKAWYKKHGAKLQWWWISYRRLLNALYKNFMVTLRMYYNGIREHGYTWYVKFARTKWKSFKQSYERRLKAANKKILKLSSKLSVKGGAVSATIQKQYLQQIGRLEQELSHFAAKQLTSLQSYLRGGWRLEIVVGGKTGASLAAGGVAFTLSREMSWPTTFDPNNCLCSAKDLLEHSWFTKMLDLWRSKTSLLRKKVAAWYKGHLVVGRWWVRKLNDVFYELYLEWVHYLNGMKSNFGDVNFQRTNEAAMRQKLDHFVQLLSARVNASLEEGSVALTWRKKSSGMRSKYLALAKYRRRFRRTYRLVCANVWREKYLVKVRALLFKLHHLGWSWYQRRGKVYKWWWKLYFGSLQAMYRRYIAVMKLWFNAIRSHGYSWYRKYGRVTWKQQSKSIMQQMESMNAAFLARSSATFVLGAKVTIIARLKFTRWVNRQLKAFSKFSRHLEVEGGVYIHRGWRVGLAIRAPRVKISIKLPKAKIRRHKVHKYKIYVAPAPVPILKIKPYVKPRIKVKFGYRGRYSFGGKLKSRIKIKRG